MTRATSKTRTPPWRPDDAAVDAIVAGRHGDPFSVLGMHQAEDGTVSVRVFWPGAGDGATCSTQRPGSRSRRWSRFIPTASSPGRSHGAARSRFPIASTSGTAATNAWQAEDAYRFPPILGELDIHLMREGTHRRLYERLGAHPMTLDGVDGVAFAVWAPNATRVSVVGDFNQWDGRRHPMRKRIEVGVWEIFIPGVADGAHYKFELLGPDGRLLPLKADPVGFRHERPPATASRVAGLVRA